MREFKFRVWDIVNKEYNYAPDKQFLISLGGELFDGNGSSYDEYHIVQQFTGLKDGNGREIYEGDIVQLQDAKRNNPVGKVYFGNGAFHANRIDCLWFGSKNGVCEDYIVIGDIFQNPDLAK